MTSAGPFRLVTQLDWVRRHIPRGALVLEVGGGDKPFLRSDVLCDRYWRDDTERGGPLLADRPLVVGALERLPFRTKAFDFVICHHVLEHVDDPAPCIDELVRVASAGSIRTPTAIAEKLTSPVYHRWLVRLREGRLIFEEKSAPVLDAEIKYFVKNRMLAGRRYGAFYRAFRPDLEVRLEWRGSVAYEVHRSASAAAALPFRRAAEDMGEDAGLLPDRERSVTARLRSLLSRAVRAAHGPKRVLLDELLACPRCRGNLRRDTPRLRCVGCASSYVVRDGVPFMTSDFGAGDPAIRAIS